MKRSNWFFILLLLVLAACGDPPEEKAQEAAPPPPGQAELDAALQRLLSEKNIAIQGFTLSKSGEVQSVYASVPQTLWTNVDGLNEGGQQLLDLLADAAAYGLDSSAYHVPAIRTQLAGEPGLPELAGADIFLTHGFLAIGRHLSVGRVDSASLFQDAPRKAWEMDLVQLLQDAKTRDEPAKALQALQPPHAEYRRLQSALASWLKGRELRDTLMDIPSHKVDSLMAYDRARDALVHHGYLDSTNVRRDTLKNALKRFQGNHGLKPDGIVGTNTALALSTSALEHYRYAAAALERWRWKEPFDSKDYLFVNVPSFTLYIVENEKVVKTHRVIVGNPRAQTPEITSAIQHLIAYPYWHVPHSIASKEILPKLKRDSTYLSRNNYEILGRGYRPVNPKTIDFSKLSRNNFPYKIRQKGGKGNALGVVKFIFPNDHMVYLHDTPTKPYFYNEIRAYSHGCIRLHKPLDMAEYLLDNDENKIRIKQINQFIKEEERTKVVLNTPMPVRIHYFTCAGDEAGNLLLYPDVYGRDRLLVERLFGKPNQEKVSVGETPGMAD